MDGKSTIKGGKILKNSGLFLPPIRAEEKKFY
jgi:hypothetical protein